MSRRHKADKREIIPDPKFGDQVLTKFMNSIMLDGKKSAAERIVYGALDQMEEKVKQNPIELFHQALQNVMPAIEVRSRRVGGYSRGTRLGMAWGLQIPTFAQSDMRSRRHCGALFRARCAPPAPQRDVEQIRVDTIRGPCMRDPHERRAACEPVLSPGPNRVGGWRPT